MPVSRGAAIHETFSFFGKKYLSEPTRRLFSTPVALQLFRIYNFDWTPICCSSFIFGLVSIVKYFCSLFSEPIP